MTYQLITPNSVLEVSLTDAKTELGIDGNDLDARLTIYIKGAAAYAEGITRRVILNQTWRTILDRFPTHIRLPFPDCSSVISVKYLDPSGVEQTLNPLDYELSVADQVSWVVPAYGKAWPSTYDKINSVKVDAVFGYGTTASDVPADYKLFILAKVREQFDEKTQSQENNTQSSFLENLIHLKKVY